jgi:hypothetical protein
MPVWKYLNSVLTITQHKVQEELFTDDNTRLENSSTSPAYFSSLSHALTLCLKDQLPFDNVYLNGWTA